MILQKAGSGPACTGQSENVMLEEGLPVAAALPLPLGRQEDAKKHELNQMQISSAMVLQESRDRLDALSR